MTSTFNEQLQCVLLLGGQGRRLGLSDLPKPMVDVAGQPLLARVLTHLRAQGLRRFVCLVNHLEDVLRGHFGNGASWDVEITWISDPGGRGTAGATVNAADALENEFLMVYGDLLFDIDVARFVTAARAAGGQGTIMVHPNSHPIDSDLVQLAPRSGTNERTDPITGFLRKPRPPEAVHRNMASAGIYHLSKSALADVPRTMDQPDWGRDFFPRAVARGAHYSGYRTIEYVKDIGTPDRLQKALADLDAGRPAHRSYRAPQPAVFLDRDGVINREIDGVTCAHDLHLLPGAAEAIAKLNAAGLPVILATNQPGVAKGFLSLDELDEIHAHLDAQLAAEGAFLDDRYVCIHHPECGHPGERAHLKIDCTCRKPKGGLMRMAAQDHNLDLSRSVMVGDRDVDMAAVTSVGGRGVRVASNGENPPGHAGHIDALDLAEAVDTLLGQWP